MTGRAISVDSMCIVGSSCRLILLIIDIVRMPRAAGSHAESD